MFKLVHPVWGELVGEIDVDIVGHVNLDNVGGFWITSSGERRWIALPAQDVMVVPA